MGIIYLDMDQEVADARARLKERFGKTQIGGKGTQRRKHKHVQKTVVTEDKKLNAAVKKFDPKTIPDIDECNMFRDDNTVLHMRKPQVQYSFREQLLVLQGNPETKNLKDMMPEILKQVGPQQFGYLKDIISQAANPTAAAEAEDEDDGPPPLVQGSFTDAADK